MKDNFDLYFREAETLYSQGEYKQALDIFKKLEEIKNNNDLSNYIGCCLLSLGDYEEAERIFKLLIDKTFDWEETVTYLSSYLMQIRGRSSRNSP